MLEIAQDPADEASLICIRNPAGLAPIGNPLPMEPYTRPTTVDAMPSVASVLASPSENASALLARTQWHSSVLWILTSCQCPEAVLHSPPTPADEGCRAQVLDQDQGQGQSRVPAWAVRVTGRV